MILIKIFYDDGDMEDVTLTELDEILLPLPPTSCAQQPLPLQEEEEEVAVVEKKREAGEKRKASAISQDSSSVNSDESDGDTGSGDDRDTPNIASRVLKMRRARARRVIVVDVEADHEIDSLI